MDEICRITLPLDPNLTSPNRSKRRRGEVIRLKQRAFQTARICWIQAGKPKANGPVRVHYLVRRGTAMDDDNIIAGCKPIRDGLFNDAITPDDSPKWVSTGSVTQEIAVKYKHWPEIIVTVEAR